MPGLRSGTTFEQNSSIGAVGESCCGMDHHPVSSVSPATTGADGSSTIAELGQSQEGGATEQTQGDDPSACDFVGPEKDRSSGIHPGEDSGAREPGVLPQPITSDAVPVVKKLCLNCGTVCVEKKKRCKKFKSGCYCSSQCRRAHAETHAELCSYIQELERIERSKHVFSVRETSQVDVKNCLVSLIGEQPTLDC